MDNVVGVTIVTERSDRKYFWSDYSLQQKEVMDSVFGVTSVSKGRGGHIILVVPRKQCNNGLKILQPR